MFTLVMKEVSYLWHISYLHPSLNWNADFLFDELNTLVVGRVGSFDKIDMMYFDRISYNLSTANGDLLRHAKHTLCFTDGCHSFDGLLDATLMESGFSLLFSACAAIKAALRSPFSMYSNKWYDFLLENDIFPQHLESPTNTRAWAGDYRLVIYMFEHFAPLCSFLLQEDILGELRKSMREVEVEEECHYRGAALLSKLFVNQWQLLHFEVI